MAISQSAVHANLNTDKILGETWWLYYCCCGGAGLGPVSDPLFGSEFKELCLHGSCTTTDLMGPDGLCGGTEVMCCITEHGQIPPLDGAPKCTCFNKAIVPGGSISAKDSLFDYKSLFDTTFWVYYIFCVGCGVSGLQAGGRPLYGISQKFLIARSTVKLEAPVVDGVYCSGVGTELCIWSQCQIPPVPSNPFIALCGWKKNKGSGGASDHEDVIGKPCQAEMK